MIYELNLHIEEATVPVIRMIQVKDYINFDTLHKIIVHTFGLSDQGTYTFYPNKSAGEVVETKDNQTETRQNKAEITTWLVQKDDMIDYTYETIDLKMNWHIRITLQNIVDVDPLITYPHCFYAQNNAPSTVQYARSELDSEIMIREINERLFMLATEQDYERLWHEVLMETKKLYDIEPWRKITDDQVYVIYDDIHDEHYFCSILGKAREVFGLSVYIGFEGMLSLLDSFEGEKTPEEIMKHQHSLLISFENREDLEKEQYDIIKRHQVTFRGKKAWPSFVSFTPGYYPWNVHADNLRQLLFVLKTTLDMLVTTKDYEQMPYILEDKIFHVRHRENSYEMNVMNVHDLMEQLERKYIADKVYPSEIELKRVTKKLYRPLQQIVEFKGTYIDIPIQEEVDVRPIFPSLVIAADHERGNVYHHAMSPKPLNEEQLQRELLFLLEELGGRPAMLLMDERTYYYVEPLVQVLNITVDIEEHLPAVDFMFQEMFTTLMNEIGKE